MHEKAVEKTRIGTDERTARSNLRRFDQNFLKSLIKVTTEKKVAYFTRGHEERADRAAHEDDKRPTVKLLKQQLEAWQFTVKPLGVAEGLATEIPKDASVVFIMGPEKPFLQGEVETLHKFVEKGGRVFLTLEGERDGDPMKDFLSAYDLTFDKTLLANERTNAPLTRTKADRAFIWSNKYSSHASVSTMTRNEKLATVFYKSGSLASGKAKLDKIKTDMVLTTVPDTFADANNNLELDEGEKKDIFGLAAAVTRTSTTGKKEDEGRVFVLADADVVADDLDRAGPGERPVDGRRRLLAPAHAGPGDPDGGREGREDHPPQGGRRPALLRHHLRSAAPGFARGILPDPREATVMNEIKVYGALLAALLVGAYLSWTKDDTPTKEIAVTIFDVKKEAVEGLTLYAKTQTVAVSFKDDAGAHYPWFEIESKGKKRGFAGNEIFTEHLAKLAPFQAQRSLGKNLTADELKQTALEKPERRLEIRYSGKKKVFDIGGRTSGSRDFYVRPQGDPEVFLVESRSISDLEFPEGRFMQRKLRTEKMEEIEKVVISSSAGTKTGLHKNRLSAKDAFWSDASAPDTKMETLENYLDKLDKLVVVEYLADDGALEDAVPILEVTWYGENEKSFGTTKLVRKGEDKKAEYYATSPATHVPVKVSKFTAEQLERDLKTLMEAK